MEEFISSALPWLLMGIALAILTVNCSVEKKKGMRIGLAAAAVLLFCVILFWVIPAKASIDNLDGITYKFSGDSFSFTREQIEAIFGKDLSNLLEKEIWEEEVQSKIADRDFLTQFY